MKIEDHLIENIVNALEKYDRDDVYIYVKNLELQYIFCSKNLLELSNVQKSDFIGKTDYDFSWSNSMIDVFRADDLYVLSTSQKHVSEYLLPFGEQKHWIKTTKTPVFDYENNVIGILGVACDISDAKKSRIMSSENLKSANDASIRLNTAIFRCFNAYSAKLISETQQLSQVLSYTDMLQKSIQKNEQISAFLCFMSEVMLKLSDRSEFKRKVLLDEGLQSVLFPYITSGALAIEIEQNIQVEYYQCFAILVCIFELLMNDKTIINGTIVIRHVEGSIMINPTLPEQDEVISIKRMYFECSSFNELLKELSGLFDLEIYVILEQDFIQGFEIKNILR